MTPTHLIFEVRIAFGTPTKLTQQFLYNGENDNINEKYSGKDSLTLNGQT